MAVIPRLTWRSFIVTRQICSATNILRSRSIFSISCARNLFAFNYQINSIHPRYVKNRFAGSGMSKTLHTGSPQLSEDRPSGESKRRPLKLMELTELIWPSPFKTIRNHIFNFIIASYYDQQFSMSEFLDGAEQAVVGVSKLISRGEFEQLNNLVTPEAIREIEENFRHLETKQREFICVNPKDLFVRFIYEIGVIIEEDNRRFVEITAVLQGFHGLGAAKLNNSDRLVEDMVKSQDQMYICNYRFIKNFTKGVKDDWIINKLNHFCPTEHVKRKGLFSR